MTTPDQPTPDQLASFEQTHAAWSASLGVVIDTFRCELADGQNREISMAGLSQWLSATMDSGALAEHLAVAVDRLLAAEAVLEQAEQYARDLQDGTAPGLDERAADDCPACTVQPYEPDLGPHHAHLTDYGYVLYGATPPQLDFVRSLLAEGRRQATEGFEPLRAAASGVKRLNRPMLDALRRSAADTSPNWDVTATVYPPSARDLVALVDALLAAVEQAKPTCTCPMFDVTAISEDPSVRKVVQGYDHACPTCPAPSWATAEQDGADR